MQWVSSLLAVMWLTLANASPFGGWGPGEGFGHLGKRPPPQNPNSNFGYDFFGTTHNRYNYSAVVMKHNEPISMRDPKFVSVAADVHHHKETYLRSGPKITSKKHLKHRSEFSSRNSRKFRRGKSFPFNNVKTGPLQKQNNLSPPTNDNKVNRYKTSRPKVKQSNKSTKFSLRSPVTTALSASELWRLNRSSHKFNNFMDKQGTSGGKRRRGRKGRQSRTRTKNILEKERTKMEERPRRAKKKSKGLTHRRKNRRLNGRRRG